MSAEPGRGGARAAWAAFWPGAALAAAFAHNLAVSWLKWGDPVVDGGREMMMPARMLLGEAIYTDQRHVYGPLAPYLNMALYRLFGVHLGVLQAAGLVVTASMSVALYALARRFVDRLPATAVTALFLYALAFAHLTPNPSFNFVVPYAYAATYGALAATFSLLMLVRHAQDGRDADLAWAVAGLALAALSKLEVLLPAAAAHAVFLTGAAIQRSVTWRRISLYAAGAVAIAVPYGLLLARAGTDLWTDNLATLVNPSIRAYAAETMGLADLPGSLAAIGGSGALLAAVTGGALAAGLFLRRDPPTPLRLLALGLPPAAGFLAYASAGVDLPFRVLPALAALSLALLAWRFVREPGRRAERLPRLVLWAFAAGCLARLGLHARAAHYGFFLLPVPMVALVVTLCRDVPAAAAASGRARAVLLATSLAVLAGVGWATHVVSAARWAEHDMDVRTPRGRMILRGERWQPEVVDYLRGLPPGSRVTAIPQGAGLLFLAGVRMVGGLYFHAPMEYSGRHTDEQVVRRFLADPPEYVVFLTQDPRSFRYTGFGIEFGTATQAWLRAHYVPVAGSPAVSILRHAGADPLRPPSGDETR